MKNAGVLSSISRLAGGLQNSVRCLHKALNALPDMQVSIFGTEDIHSAEDVPEWAPMPVTLCPFRGPRAFSYAPTMLARLLESDNEIIHSHGIWQFPSLAVGRWHAQTRRPYLISPHGMLDPWAVKNSHWKKVLAHAVYQGSHLQNAACIRALCESEARAVRSYGLKNPICIIPNGIDLPEEESEGLKVESPRSGERKILLFLGRVHPKKGLPNALRAWAKIRGQGAELRGQEEWQFVVAGWDQNGHEAELKRLCDELGLGYAEVPAAEFVIGASSFITAHGSLGAFPSVVFVGPAFGEHKDALLRRASAFILPSFSEGLPMSVLEAWSYRLPVLMTDHCNLPEGFTAAAATRIGCDVESIAEGMRLILRAPASDLRSLGANGRALVEHQFAWPMVAAQMKDVYEWVLGGGDKPGCVVL